MTPVVIDTNVFVAAALNPSSSAARVMEAVAAGRLRLVWDQATRREIEHVIRKIPRLNWESIEPLFRAENAVGGANPERFHHIEDVEDRKFAALANEARATLVTNDRHLLDHRNREPAVATPTEVVRVMLGN